MEDLQVSAACIYPRVCKAVFRVGSLRLDYDFSAGGAFADVVDAGSDARSHGYHHVVETNASSDLANSHLW